MRRERLRGTVNSQTRYNNPEPTMVAAFPNSELLLIRLPLTPPSRTAAWNFDIGIGYGDDIDQAKQLLYWKQSIA